MSLLSQTTASMSDGLAYFFDQMPEQSDFLAEVISGLSQSPKSIPPKFFYDEAGSYLFNKICETPEYYVTRTEISLLNNNATEISALIGAASNVIEYGCGSSLKINALLSALHEPAEYLAIDISREYLIQTAKSVAKTFPTVKVGALCADFMEIMDLPEIGSMSSTHSANPLVSIAGEENLKTILNDGLITNSEKLGKLFHEKLNDLKNKYPDYIKHTQGKGLLAALIFIDKKGNVLNKLCDEICERAFQKGLLVVHTGRESIKLAPPLTITEEALLEGINVLDECIQESV